MGSFSFEMIIERLWGFTGISPWVTIVKLFDKPITANNLRNYGRKKISCLTFRKKNVGVN